MSEIRVTRRGVLRTFGGVAALAAAGSLSACGSSSPSGAGSESTAGAGSTPPAEPTSAGSTSTGAGSAGPSGSGASGVQLPAFVLENSVPADLPASADGISPGYLKYPADPKSVFSAPPGDGSTVTAFVPIYGAVPPSVDKNKYWQELNRQVGAKMNFIMAPASGWVDKFSTMVAGGSSNLPDLSQIPVVAPHWTDILTSEFHDLTDFVGGDAVKDYPFLAGLPTQAWRACLNDGRIYGVPVPRPLTGQVMYARKDIADSLKADLTVTDFTSFMSVCKALTDESKSRWALDGAPAVQSWVQEMLKIPNTWAAADGKFTAAIETDEYQQTIDAVQQLLAAGVFEPDSFASSADPKGWFAAGRTLLHYDSYRNWGGFAVQLPDPSTALAAIAPVGFAGGAGSQTPQSPSFNLTAIKKGSQARVKQLLEICNWFAAPFGTKEYLFRKFGVEGVDYRLDGTDPVLTSTGTTETGLPTLYVTDSPYAVYQPKQPDVVSAWYEYQKAAVPIIVPDPTVGLYSPTNGTQGGQLTTAITNALADIYQGRKKASSWSSIVTAWRKAGGDKIRDEYEKAYAVSPR